MNGQASITVDLQARIGNLKEILAQMQKEAEKVDIGSSLGKSLKREIASAEKELDNLGKHANVRITSEGGIDSLNNKLENIGSRIQSIGQDMQKVTFNDISTEVLENSLKKLRSEWEQTKKILEEKINLGFTEGLDKSPQLKKYLESLGADLKNLDVKDIDSLLSNNLEQAQEHVKQTTEELETLKQKYEEIKQQMASMDASDSLYSRLKSSLDVLGNTDFKVDTILNSEVLEAKVQEWEKQIDNLTQYTDTQKTVFKNTLREYFDPSLMGDVTTAEDFRRVIQQFKEQFKEIFANVGGEGQNSFFNLVFGSTSILKASDINKLFQLDPQALEEGKKILLEQLNQFNPSELKNKTNIEGLLIDENALEKALKATLAVLREKYAKLDEEHKKLQTEQSEALGQVRTAGLKKGQAVSAETVAKDRYIEFLNRIEELEKNNKDLQDQLTALQEKINGGKENFVSNIRKKGAEGQRKVDSELRVAAEDAKMYRTELEQVQAKEKLIGKIEGVVQRWFSIYAAVRMVGNAIRSVISTVQELDKTITEIAIVTNMTQNELWGQMKSYTDMARQYAASISGVYQVSQLYYQQGLQTADVMALTEETLKMARISGLDYAEATNYMTNAIRSFKMEMTDAQRVVDVYSEIAASSATSTSELASAMSKTASSAAAVGSSFENTTAMMAVMIEATREAPENIGSAMKSIISRYGEMKADPTKLIDSEGQEMSLNKVDKALQSVGISIQDVNHQFRDFDDVITELASKWDTIDTNTQRYIATIMAGNRQQSRFLALVSNGERLAELSEKAANSEDAATLQVLKTMDSIEAKTQQLKTSLQSLYTSTGIQNLFKGFLDVGNQIVKTFTQMPTVFGAPIPAILKIGTTFASLANVVTTVFGLIKAKTQAQIVALNGQEQAAAQERVNITNIEYTEKDLIAEQTNAYIEARMHGLTETEAMEARERVKIAQQEAEQKRQAELDAINGRIGITKKNAGTALGLNIAGVALSTISGAIDTKTRSGQIAKGAVGIAGSAASMAGLGTMIAPGWGTAIGAALGGVMGIVENINFLFESAEARAQRLKEAATEANNTYLQKKEDYRSLDEQIKKLKELEKARYDSAEANEEYLQASNTLASSYPELIGYIDQEGNAIVNLANDYDVLANARLTAQQAAIDAAEKSARQAQDAYDTALESRGKNRSNIAENWLNDQLTEQDLAKWAEAGIDTVGLPANTRKNLLKNIGQQLQEKADSGDEQINNDYDLLAMINNLISDDQVNLDFFNEQIEKEKENLQRIKSENPEDELIQAYFSLIESLTGNLLSVDQDISQKSNVVDATNRAAIANATYWASQAKLANEKENADFLNDFDVVNEVISSYVNSQFEVFKQKNTDEKGKATIDFQEGETWYSKFRDATEDGFNQSYEAIYSQIQTLWNNLGTDIKQNDFNKLISNRGIYAADQFAKIIQEKYGIASDSELGQSLLSYYDTAFKWEDFDKAIAARQEASSQLDVNWIYKFGGLLDSLSGAELQNILEVYDNIEKQIENKNISQELGQSILDTYLNIWNTIHEEQWDNEALEEAQALLLNADLFSLTGLEEFRKAVENSDLSQDRQQDLIGLAEKFTNLVPKNLTTELASFQQKAVSGIEDFEKAISNASKGMDFKTATELAQKIGKNITDFEFKDGKYFATDYFDEIQKAYFGTNEQLKANLKTLVEREETALEDLSLTELISDDKLVFAFTQESGEELRELLEANLDRLPENLNIDSIVAAYDTFLQEVTDGSQTFIEWASQQNDIRLKEAIDAVDQYTVDLKARSLLSKGDFSQFLDKLNFTGDLKQALMQDFLDSDIEDLLLRIPKQYHSTLISTLENVNDTVLQSILTGAKEDSYIKSTDATDAFYEAYTQGENAILRKVTDNTYEFIGDTYDALITQIKSDDNLTDDQRQSLLKDIHAEQYKDNLYDSLENVIKSYDSVSYDTIQSLANALNKTIDDLLGGPEGSIFRDIAPVSINDDGTFKVNLERLDDFLTFQYDKLSDESYNKIRAQLEQTKFTQNTDNVIRDIINKREQLTSEDIGNLATALGEKYEDLIARLKLQQNDDGTYRMSLDTLWNQFAGQMNDTLTEYVASEIDKVISSMTNLSADQSKGYTSVESIQKYADSLKQQGIKREDGRDFDLKDLFEYNDTLKAYQLTTTGIIAQIISVKEQIQPLIGEQRAIAETFINNSVKEFADAIDLSSFLDADFGSAAAVQAEVKIKKAVEDYNSALLATGETAGINADKLIDALKTGGEVAVKAMEQVAKQQGKTLSASDVESAYRGEIDKYVNAIDTIIAKPGEIIDTITADLIITNGGQVNEIGNTGQYVVETAANLYEAYNDLLRRMAATGEATLADLNKVAALALENHDGEQQIIDALGDAAGMTFTRFGEILANAGVQLTEDMVNNLEAAGIIDLMGGNKMKIVDFQAFADLMNWDANSEEYVSAFKSYNDSLIDMNRQAERNILEEAQNVAGAKGGDWINLTQLMSKLQEGFKYVGSEKISLGDSLAASIQKFGAKIEDGILKIDDSANIPAIMQEIAQAAAQSGGLLANELAELADAVADAIKGYADLISGGIEGSLSNAQAEELQDWATANGIGKLDFTETKDGLKVATDQAFELVAALRQVDSMQGKLTFDKLVDSLSADKGGQFENISKITAEIAKAQKEIAENNEKIAEIESTYPQQIAAKKIAAIQEQNNKLHEQINLYRQIQQAQSIEPSQYNFMDRELPDVMNGPINYWNSVGKAYSALNEAGQTGKMDIQDFTNIVNEMSNLAATSGQKLMFFGQEIDGSAENAAALIQKGYTALSNVDGKGVKVDLSKMGIDFAAGADNAKNNFDKGVQSLAKAQVAMLDAAIKVLEVVVAMEKLGDIDVDKDNQLDLSEIFDIEGTEDFKDKYKEWAENIYEVTHDPNAENFNKDLAEGLESISINGNTMKDLIYAATSAVDEGAKAFEELGLSQQAYTDVINAFYQALLNGDYNLDTIQDSVWDILDQTLPDGTTIDVGDRTIIISGGSHFSIDWEAESTKEALAKITGKKKAVYTEQDKQDLQDSLEKYYTGQNLTEVDIETGLIFNSRIKTKNGKKTIISPSGKEITEGEEGYEQALAANVLADLTGQELSNITYDGEVPTTTITYPKKDIETKVTYTQEKGIQYWGPDGEGPYKSEDAMFNALYEKALTDFMGSSSAAENEYARNQAKNSYTKEMFLYEKFGIRVRVGEVSVTNENGEKVEPSTDPEIRKKLKEQLNGGEKGFQEAVESGDATVVDLKNGKVRVDIKGFGGIEVDKVEGEEGDPAATMQRAVMEALGVDESLVDNITTAITNAFTADEGALSKAIGEGIMSGMTNWTPPEGETPTIPEIQAEVTSVKITKIGGATYEAGEENVTPPNIDSLNATVNSLKLDAADIDVDSVGEQIQEALADLEITVPIKTPTPAGNTNNGGQQEQPESGSSTMTMNVVVNDEASSKIDEVQEKASSPIDMPIKADADGSASNKIEQLNQKAGSSVFKNVDVGAELTAQYKTTIAEATKPEDKIINIKTNGSVDTGPGSKAGNVALAKGTTGTALARGRTLMGELGPELVVSKGRYFVVGQNGPEMVNLDPDAIVFNHLQTRQLLANGKTGTHATPVTNERKATSLATGNASGPAMASASAALAALKQLRAMWQSLADASLKDLGGMPGGSGGGGGGGGGDKTPAEIKSITQQVERWYNWMKEIEEIQTNLNKLSKEYTLLEKQHIASQTKLANLQNQQAETLRDINTRSGLIKEQKDYRSQEIARVTKEGSAFNAFYGVDEKTGRIYLKNDDAANAGFKEFLKGTKSSLGSVMTNEGKISAGTKIDYKQSYTQKDADEDYAAWLETAEGQNASKKQKKKKKKQLKKKVGKKINKTLTTGYDIRTGADLMNELQRKDKQGNNVHDAQEQYLLLDKLGIIKKMPELMAGIDKSQEGWQETAVENFYNAIDADKEAIETLTDSINEQEEALLDDKIQMQEINDQIRELAKPLPGVTEGFEKWYNELKRIEAIQERINILSKQNSLLQNDHIANGKEIFLNYKQQEEELEKQLKANEDLYNKQVKGREDLVKKYQSLPIDYDASTGTATFNEKKYNKSIKISHTDTKKNSLGYEVDEQGRYIDNKGILRDAGGKKLNSNTEMFGQVQTTTVDSTYNTNGKTLPQILEEITSQNANGETAYTAEEQYGILKGLGFEKLLQYDESGKQIYENFGELTKEQMKEAVEAGISRIQGAADEINEYTSDINKITEENLDIQNNLYEIESARIQNAIDLENLVKDAIVQERQDAIDAKKDLRDALDKAANKTVDGLKESLDREKALYDSDSDTKELTALQAQLTLLRSAGGSLGKIRDLESQIQDKQKDMYFAERENSIENLENAAQKQIDALDTQIDIMQTSLDYQVEQGLIWEEVNRKISTEGPDSLASYIVENQKGFLANSPTQQKEDLTEILQTAQFGKAQIEDAKNPETPKTEEKQEPKKNQEKKESKPEPKKEESKNQPKTTSQPDKQPKAQTNLTTQQQNALKSDLQPHLVSDSPKDRPKTTEVEEPEKVTVTTVKKGLKYYSKKTANSKTKSLGKISKGTSFDVKGIGKTKTYTTSKKKKRYMLKAEIGGREVYVPLLYTWLKNGKDLESKLIKSKLPKFAKGGSVDFTGPAWVDGTKSKPEQIFNYDQMEQLRKMFLDNLTATQIGIAGLSSIADKLPNTNSYNSINNENSGVNIDQLDFHMEVEQISNDYDARRAGQAAMEEMVRIARKTGNRSISRR